MKRVIVAGTILLLAGCSVNRQAEISSLDAPNGIVRLDYGQAVLQNAWSDEYVNNGTGSESLPGYGVCHCVCLRATRQNLYADKRLFVP